MADAIVQKVAKQAAKKAAVQAIAGPLAGAIVADAEWNNSRMAIDAARAVGGIYLARTLVRCFRKWLAGNKGGDPGMRGLRAMATVIERNAQNARPGADN